MSDRAPESSAAPSGPRPELVLLIDDDAGITICSPRSICDITVIRLKPQGSVEEAEKIKHRLGADGIGVVIVDVHLTPNPRFHEGYSLYEDWIAQHPTLPFLLISGISASQNLPAISAGNVPFLAKPFTMEALLAWVQQLLTVSNMPPDISGESGLTI